VSAVGFAKLHGKRLPSGQNRLFGNSDSTVKCKPLLHFPATMSLVTNFTSDAVSEQPPSRGKMPNQILNPRFLWPDLCNWGVKPKPLIRREVGGAAGPGDRLEVATPQQPLEAPALMHPSQHLAAPQQRRVDHHARHADSRTMFDLLTGPQLLEQVDAWGPAHRERL
jgi:hypothetical protein